MTKFSIQIQFVSYELLLPYPWIFWSIIGSKTRSNSSVLYCVLGPNTTNSVLWCHLGLMWRQILISIDGKSKSWLLLRANWWFKLSYPNVGNQLFIKFNPLDDDHGRNPRCRSRGGSAKRVGVETSGFWILPGRVE